MSMSCSTNTEVTFSLASARGEDVHDAELFGRGDAGGRLVHQQQFRLQGQRQRDIDQLALASGQFRALRSA